MVLYAIEYAAISRYSVGRWQRILCPPVAQLVEREAYTFVVPGSSPGGRTKLNIGKK